MTKTKSSTVPSLLLPTYRKIVRTFRAATWSIRPLPQLIIIGSQKSGTTSLYSYLSQHSDLVPSFAKEVHYFDGGLNPNVDTFSKGERWYRSHFPLKFTKDSKSIAFEASPMYIFNPLVAKRIHDQVPEVKLIAVLRNPVDRAISHYFHEKKRGVETLPLLEALHSEEERLSPVIKSLNYKHSSYGQFSYKLRGHYYEQLARYFERFPRHNLLVISSEHLFTQPDITLRKIFKFAEVDMELKMANLTPQNVGSNKTSVDPAAIEYLENYFQPLNKKLFNLLDEEFDW